MKKLILILLLSICFSLAQASTFYLSISGGYGSGTFDEGDTIHLWSNKPAFNSLFTHWSGDGASFLESDDDWHTTMVVPVGTAMDSVFLVAHTDRLPAGISRGSDSLLLHGEYNHDASTRFRMQKPYVYAYPPAPKGIVFMFHGTGGNGASMFTRFEINALVKDLLYENYAVFSFSANESDLGNQNGSVDTKIRWRTTSQPLDTSGNVDFLNVANFKKYIDDNLGFGNIPTFAVGVSNGASFSDVVAALFDFKAVAHILAHGRRSLFNSRLRDVKPTIWLQTRSDRQENADSLAMRANMNTLIRRGIETELHWLDKSPAHPQRFLRSLKGITAAQAQSVFDELKQKNHIDADNYIVYDTLETQFPWTRFYNNISPSLGPGQENDVESQIKALNADHVSFSEKNKRIIDFFERILASTTGVEKEIAVSGLKVYPNPTEGHIYIVADEPIERLEIYDVQGKLLIRKAGTGGKLEVDLSGLDAGLYFVQINGVEMRKLLRI